MEEKSLRDLVGDLENFKKLKKEEVYQLYCKIVNNYNDVCWGEQINVIEEKKFRWESTNSKVKAHETCLVMVEKIEEVEKIDEMEEQLKKLKMESRKVNIENNKNVNVPKNNFKNIKSEENYNNKNYENINYKNHGYESHEKQIHYYSKLVRDGYKKYYRERLFDLDQFGEMSDILKANTAHAGATSDLLMEFGEMGGLGTVVAIKYICWLNLFEVEKNKVACCCGVEAAKQFKLAYGDSSLSDIELIKASGDFIAKNSKEKKRTGRSNNNNNNYNRNNNFINYNNQGNGCYYCGGFGHIASNCFQRQSDGLNYQQPRNNYGRGRGNYQGRYVGRGQGEQDHGEDVQGGRGRSQF